MRLRHYAILITMTGFSVTQWVEVMALFLSFVGILLTIYIRYKKVTKKPMVCPLNGHCEEVVNSQFSKFLGVPVELMGMAYYAMTATVYGLLLGAPEAVPTRLLVLLFIATAGGFLFSLYLIFVQAFLLREHCTWCLGSAGISTIMFFLTMYVAGGTALVLLAPYSDVLLSVYSLALALGVGSVTLGAVFLLKFLRDLHVAAWEADGLHTISQISWLALAVLVVSGSLLYVLPIGAYGLRSYSLLQIVLLLIMTGTAAILDLLITPKLIKISNGESHMHQMGELRLLRRVAFGSSAIMLVTWYTTFILGTVAVAWPHKTVFLAYLLATLVAILISQTIEGRLMREMPKPEGI